MSFYFPTVCSECGKVLNGRDGRDLRLGITVNAHAPKGAPTGSPRNCPGARRNAHQPKPRKATPR